MPIGMAQIQNTDHAECGQDGGSGPSLCRWPCKMVQPPWEVVWRILTKLNRLIWPSTRAPWYLLDRAGNLCPHKNLHLNVYGGHLDVF